MVKTTSVQHLGQKSPWNTNVRAIRPLHGEDLNGAEVAQAATRLLSGSQ